MQVINQHFDEILRSLRDLSVDWQDDTAKEVISTLGAFRVKRSYSLEDVQKLLDQNFDDGLLICRLFLGLSKDQFTGVLRGALGKTPAGVTGYREKPTLFMEAIKNLGVLEAMAEVTNRKPHWSDVLVERLRSGRGSAIMGQRRGRVVEDFVENIVKSVFSDRYESRCNFVGQRGDPAKCDFAIPSKTEPRIIIEAKGYGATGSKMTDVLGDIGKIIEAKRSDTTFLFFTDGVTWRQRTSDLKKIVGYQNRGAITRIYTYAMAKQFEKDLRQLRREYRI